MLKKRKSEKFHHFRENQFPPDATYLTSVPRSVEKTAAVLLVVLGHLQAVHPFHVEADLVLRVELSTRLAQLALKDTLVGPSRNIEINFEPTALIRNPPINVGLNVGHLPCLLLLLFCGRVLVVHHQPTVLLHCHPVVHLHTSLFVNNRAIGDWVTNLIDCS